MLRPIFTLLVLVTLAGCSCGDDPIVVPAAPAAPEAVAPVEPPSLPQIARPEAMPVPAPEPTAVPLPDPELGDDPTAVAEATPSPAAAPEEATADGAEPPSAEPARRADRPEAPELHDVAGLQLARLVIAPRIEQREPAGAASRFRADEDRVYAFVELRNDGAVERTVTVVFVGPAGQRTGAATLTVPPGQRRWRTWASTRNARAPGRWTATVTTAEGELVGRVGFTVVRPGAA